MKKLATMAISIVLIACMVAGGSLAYLQDQDEAVNVMTLGSVKIEQIEQEWNADKSKLVDFTQAKPLYPYVGTLAWGDRDEEDDGAYRQFAMNNVVDKYVSVKNTGKSDAYVRTIIALEMGKYDNLTDFASSGIGLSVNSATGTEFPDMKWKWTDDFMATIDGKNYNVMVAVHEEAVEPGETTIPSLLQVYLSKDAGNAEVEKLDGNGNGTYDILVLSQAVQTAGFEASVSTVDATSVTKTAAEVALDTAFGKATATNVPVWFSGDDAVISKVLYSYDDFNSVYNKPGNYVLGDDIISTDMIKFADFETNGTMSINLNGKTITAENTNQYAFGTPSKMLFDGSGTVNMAKGFFITDGGTITVDGGTYNMTETSDKGHLFVQNDGKLIINGGTFITSDPNTPIAYCINGFIEINGGFFQNTANPNQALLSMGNNLNYINNQKITLKGGTFVNWNPMNSAFAKDWPQCPALIVLADGCEVVSKTQANGDVWYTVVEK